MVIVPLREHMIVPMEASFGAMEEIARTNSCAVEELLLLLATLVPLALCVALPTIRHARLPRTRSVGVK